MGSLKTSLLADHEEASRRLAICRACEFSKTTGTQLTCGTPIVGDQVKYKGKKHRTCGCFLDLKTKLKPAACPLGKWGDKKEEAKTMERARALVDSVKGRNRISSEEADELREVWRLLVARDNDPPRCGKCLLEMRDYLIRYVESRP